MFRDEFRDKVWNDIRQHRCACVCQAAHARGIDRSRASRQRAHRLQRVESGESGVASGRQGPSAELLAVLDEWMSDIAAGDSAAMIANDLGPSLTVDFNTQNANLLCAGNGLDWFWATYALDHTNRKSTDLLN